MQTSQETTLATIEAAARKFATDRLELCTVVTNLNTSIEALNPPPGPLYFRAIGCTDPITIIATRF
jgi:hypothetical protein